MFKNWIRLEPSSKRDQVFIKNGQKIIEESSRPNLAVEVRDPAWLLFRQWQFGEFQGEDAATPAYVRMNHRTAPINKLLHKDDFGKKDTPRRWLSYDVQKAPLEAYIEAERTIPNDLVTAVELGQWFEDTLNQDLVEIFRKTYPIPKLSLVDGRKLRKLADTKTLSKIVTDPQIPIKMCLVAQLHNAIQQFIQGSKPIIVDKLIELMESKYEDELITDEFKNLLEVLIKNEVEILVSADDTIKTFDVFMEEIKSLSGLLEERNIKAIDLWNDSIRGFIWQLNILNHTASVNPIKLSDLKNLLTDNEFDETVRKALQSLIMGIDKNDKGQAKGNNPEELRVNLRKLISTSLSMSEYEIFDLSDNLSKLWNEFIEAFKNRFSLIDSGDTHHYTPDNLQEYSIFVQIFEDILAESRYNLLDKHAILVKLRKACSFPKEVEQLSRMWSGQMVNGVLLFFDFDDDAKSNVPWQKLQSEAKKMEIPLNISDYESQIKDILIAFFEHVKQMYGLSFDKAAYAWRGKNLEYRTQLQSNGHKMDLEPNHLGDIDWHSFDSLTKHDLPARQETLDGIKFLKAATNRSQIARLAKMVNPNEIEDLLPVLERLYDQIAQEYYSELTWSIEKAREIGKKIENAIDNLSSSGKSVKTSKQRERLKRTLRSMFPLMAKSIIPGHVRFKGMPNARWWQFENNETSFGDIWPDERELPKLALIDFMLIQSNDWFVIPLIQPIGTIQDVSLTVCDVFGNTTLVETFDNGRNGTNQSMWSLFSMSIADGDQTKQLNRFISIPPSITSLAQKSEKIEEVQFTRDEMANLVWAVENEVENLVGLPKLIYENQNESDLKNIYKNKSRLPVYQLHSDIPLSWIHYTAEERQQVSGEVVLKRDDDASHLMSEILKDSVEIREEEIARTGIKIDRIVNRCRWIDGSTHVWISRRKTQGTGSKNSGLRFDFITY